jgi:adenylate kinase family enzyme
MVGERTANDDMSGHPARRIAVIGSSGSGKSTMAKAIGHALGLPVIELDAINWQAGWRDLNTDDAEEFVRRVTAAIAAPEWVSDGNYGRVAPHIIRRATDVIWLDYGRPLIMSRVIRRSLARSLTRREVWPNTGNVEYWRNWLGKEHPVWWAWSTFARLRQRYEEAFAGPALAHVTLHRLRRPRAARKLLDQLRSERA